LTLFIVNCEFVRATPGRAQNVQQADALDHHHLAGEHGHVDALHHLASVIRELVVVHHQSARQQLAVAAQPMQDTAAQRV
jgi:hypothetical protein